MEYYAQENGKIVRYVKCVKYCPKCGNYYEPDTLVDFCLDTDNLRKPDVCECCGDELLNIDYNIFDVVKMLNDKGYTTCGSCEGHKEYGSNEINGFIIFDLNELSNDAIDNIVHTFVEFYCYVLEINMWYGLMEIRSDGVNRTLSHIEFDRMKRLWLRLLEEFVDELPDLKHE